MLSDSLAKGVVAHFDDRMRKRSAIEGIYHYSQCVWPHCLSIPADCCNNACPPFLSASLRSAVVPDRPVPL